MVGKPMVTADNTIKEWVEAYTNALYGWAFYKLSDEELAKDIVQETFISAFQKYETFAGKSNPRTWLFSILNHKLVDHYRKQLRTPVEYTIDNTSDFFDGKGMWQKNKRPKEWEYETALLDDPGFLKVLYGCMGKLPQQWAAAVQLKYMSGKDGGEICRELEMTQANYWQIIRRAKLSLRQCIELKWFK